MGKGILIGLGGVAAAGFLLVGIFFLTWMSANNAEVSARNAFVAQQKSNESSFDKMWKTLKQMGGIPESERASFEKAYVNIMTATKGVAGNGQLASFFQQAKIDIPPTLFANMMSTIEAQRESFHRDQQKLLKMKQQHDDVRTKWPSAFFVGSRPEVEAKIVTSAKTTAAFETGEDNEI